MNYCNSTSPDSEVLPQQMCAYCLGTVARKSSWSGGQRGSQLMFDKALIRALHTFRNVHNSAGFINMKRAPFWLHFTHLLEAASQSWILKLKSSVSPLAIPAHHTVAKDAAKEMPCQECFPSCSCVVTWARQSALSLLFSSPALLWRPLRCSLQWNISLRQKQRKNASRIELGTNLWHDVQLQFCLPKFQ